MGHEQGCLKCFKTHCRREQAAGGCCSAWFLRGGKGQQLFSGGPIKDTARSWVLLTQSIGKWEAGKQASFLVRDQLRGVARGLGMPVSSCAWFWKGHEPCGPCGNKDQNFKKADVCWGKHWHCGHPGAQAAYRKLFLLQSASFKVAC